MAVLEDLHAVLAGLDDDDVVCVSFNVDPGGGRRCREPSDSPRGELNLVAASRQRQCLEEAIEVVHHAGIETVHVDGRLR